MSEVVTKFFEDHRYGRKLLNAVERQRDLLVGGEFLDEAIIEGVLVYFTYYPSIYHHPEEDLLYRKFVEFSQSAAKAVGDLEASHVALRDLLSQLQTVSHQVITLSQHSRQGFIDTATRYVDTYCDHMDLEETVFFPAALDVLRPEEWAELGAQVSASPDDPLFGNDLDERFKALRRDIVEWDAAV